MLTKEETGRFDALYREHSAAIFRVCLAMAAGDRSWAFDRTQDAFVKLANNLGRLDEVENVGGWLYRVAVNECRMNLRRHGTWRRVRAALKVAPKTRQPAGPERRLQSGENARTLEEATAQMPEKLRTIVTLIYVEGKSQAEVCDIIGLSKGQVSKLHKKALERLRDHDWEVDL